MCTSLTFTAQTEPKCKSFFRIKQNSSELLLNEFAELHSDDMDEAIRSCDIIYRDVEMTYQKMVDDYVAFTESLAFFSFNKPMFIIDPSVRVSAFFVTKAAEYLQSARYYVLKSASLLETNYYIKWKQGYVPQFLFRCLDFGTAATWYANSFDQILQVVFWGDKLYTSVIDKEGNAFSDTWDTKKIVALCTYEFVVGELKTRGLNDVRKILTTCSTQIEEVRKWSNYIKHKGGVDYKYLEPEPPFEMYFVPVSEVPKESPPLGDEMRFERPDERFAIKDFKSPIQIDIDKKYKELQKAHQTIHYCLSEIVKALDFDAAAVQIRT